MTDTDACPSCGRDVGQRNDGTLEPHYRYEDGSGPGPGQPHTLEPCEVSSEGGETDA